MNPALLLLFPAIPLLAAAVTVLIRATLVNRVLLLAVPALSLAAAGGLLAAHRTTPVIAHHTGGFVPGVAIPFASDTLTAAMLAVTALTTAVTASFLIATAEDRYRFAVPLVLMLHGGVNGALLTADLFNLFVFIEVMLLPSYALIAITGTWRRLGIGRMFVLVNVVTSTVLLIGVALVYASAGTVIPAALVGAASRDPRLDVAVTLVLAALAIKGAVVPVQAWLPRAYPATSAAMMALFAGLHTKVALYAIYRIYTLVYDGPAPWWPVILAVAVAGMLLGSVATFGESRIRDALAHQMVAGVGHILIGLVVASQFALGAGLLYLIHHVITMGGLLLTAGAIEHTYGSGRYDRLQGLMRRDPLVAAVFALGLFSLIGLPPTSGLWAKAGLVVAALSAGPVAKWILILALVAASVASLVGLQHLWRGVFWGPPMENYRPEDPLRGRGELVPVTDDVRVQGRLLAPGAALIVASLAVFAGIGGLTPVLERAGAGLHDPSSYRQAVLP